jgi:hypothetical protein
MSKAATYAEIDETIKPGRYIRGGNISFRLISLDPHKSDWWHVQQIVPGVGFFRGKRTKPNTTQMSLARVRQLIEDEDGFNAASNMNTMGGKAGEQSRRGRNTKERFPLRFCGFNQQRPVAAIGI